MQCVVTPLVGFSGYMLGKKSEDFEAAELGTSPQRKGTHGTLKISHFSVFSLLRNYFFLVETNVWKDAVSQSIVFVTAGTN